MATLIEFKSLKYFWYTFPYLSTKFRNILSLISAFKIISLCRYMVSYIRSSILSSSKYKDSSTLTLNVFIKSLRTGSKAAKFSNLEESSAISFYIIRKYYKTVTYLSLKLKLLMAYFIFGRCVFTTLIISAILLFFMYF